MKPSKFKFAALLLSLCLAPFLTRAQWQNEIRLTNNPAISGFSQNNARCLAVAQDTLHVVWFDTRDGNMEIYYKRSVNSGVSWSSDTRLTNDPGASASPAIAVEGANVYLVWEDDRDGNREIYFMKSENSGASWGTAVRLSNSSAPSLNASITVSGANVYVVWNEGLSSVHCSYSFFYGANWSAPSSIMSLSSGTINAASISASGSNLVAVSTFPNPSTVYYRRSFDYFSWASTYTRLPDTSGTSFSPCVSVSGSMVHAVWSDSRHGNSEIYYKRSPDVGLNWGADVRLTNSANDSYDAQVACNGNIVTVVWEETNGSGSDIYIRHSEDGGLSWSTPSRLTNTAASSERPMVALNSPKAYVAFSDNRTADYELYFLANYNTVTSVEDPVSNPEGRIGSIYPNPANGEITITSTIHNTTTFDATIYDIYGNRVDSYKRLSSNTTTLKVDHLSPGCYFLKLSDENNNSAAKRFVIAR